MKQNDCEKCFFSFYCDESNYNNFVFDIFVKSICYFCINMNFFFVVVVDAKGKDKGKTFEIKASVVKNFSNYKKSIAVIFFEENSNAVQSIITTIEIIESKIPDLINRKIVEYLKIFFYFGTQGAFIFNEKRIINFLNTYQKICSAYIVSKKNKYVVCINIAFLRQNNILKVFLSKSLRMEKNTSNIASKIQKIEFCSKNRYS